MKKGIVLEQFLKPKVNFYFFTLSPFFIFLLLLLLFCSLCFLFIFSFSFRSCLYLKDGLMVLVMFFLLCSIILLISLLLYSRLVSCWKEKGIKE